VIGDRSAGRTRRRSAGKGITLSVQEAGLGAPLILLHGLPQNGMCRWRAAAAAFAVRNRVNIPDPRGGGQSVALADDATCSRRAMAQGIVARMAAPGLSQAAIPGHDRVRVACGLVPEHPRRVTGTGITEIAPIPDDRAARLRTWALPPATEPFRRGLRHCPGA
jgi:haloacetate dehalogenase